VRLFASLRELAGVARLDVDGATVEDVVVALEGKFGERFGQIARAGSVVVDGERSGFDRRLDGTEEVALLPPVSGGASGPASPPPAAGVDARPTLPQSAPGARASG
jgi:molybdopterin converting factor small subunit